MGYKANSLEIETWNQSRQFIDDLVGMRTLWKQHKLHLLTCHTKHRDARSAPNRDFFFRYMLKFFNNTL